VCVPSTKKGRKENKEETRHLDYNRARAQRPSWARQEREDEKRQEKERKEGREDDINSLYYGESKRSQATQSTSRRQYIDKKRREKTQKNGRITPARCPGCKAKRKKK
jgi:hypothetical protein